MKIKPLITNLAISLGVGIASALITKNSMELYENINKPALSPPSVTFPIVWTILFILMGISSYLVYISKSTDKKDALKIYAFQLFANFVWPILFFNNQLYLFSFIWLIVLLLLVLTMIIAFFKISKPAGLLQVPYILWITFASYLNIMVYILNR
ncbi:MAG: tryptophan-rich sensory protein [Oscillospiraceae bacterium]|nr:tryptophan-rich sensory protein [Oscillospiraceae bacterium]